MVSFTASARAAILASVLLPRHILAVPQSSSPALVPRIWNGKKYGCKCYIGDSCWPAEPAWTHLNKTLDGNLAVDIPPGAPCHDEFNGPLGTVKTYDAAKCAEVTSNFASEDWTVSLPAAALWTFFTNETCRPTLNRKDVCTLGYYPIYVIMAKTTSHIKAGIDFARANNLRLIVRNTGHDFLGRSTGFGSLVINTHSFKDYTFHKSYRGPGNYSGPCVEVGAGVQGREFLRVGHERTPPVVVVTGECPTVGIAGGLVGGGGHGPWTTLKGFASDNALEFHAITADGVVRKANAEENPDLYWALKGGGPGAFAVILSVTYAVFEDVRSAGAILNINRTHTTDTQLWWKGVTAFHGYANHFVDSGLYVYWELAELSLHIQPFVAIGQSASDLREILKPLLDDLDRLGLEYSFSIKEFSTFFDLYIDMFEDEGAGGTAITGGWMFSHNDVAKNNEGIIGSFQNALANGAFIVGHLWDAGHSPTITESAINPRFKQSSDFAIVALPVAVNASLGEKAAAQELLTSNIDLELQKAGPCGANYVNEADPFQDNWQEHFWGTNYPKLLEIKKKWDPDTLFYYVSTPGTEDWEQIEHNTRLCKKL